MAADPSTAAARPPVRTITVGVPLESLDDPRPLERALADLAAARRRFADAGWEVQTVRAALPPLLAGVSREARAAAIGALRRIDALARNAAALVSIGPVLREDREVSGLTDWAVDLVDATESLFFSVEVARGATVRRGAASTAAAIVRALGTTQPQGLANFRFAAAAGVPAGTPFFPVAFHEGPPSLAIALESAAIVGESCREIAEGRDTADASATLAHALEQIIQPAARIGEACAHVTGRTWLGVDPSPAPGLDRSIGAAIETLSGVPFGAPGTLDACATITGGLKAIAQRTCGYAGLMLPVLEDVVLARRAIERRFSVRDLLSFSAVCGTGLDVVPLPGDIEQDELARLITDVAALSARLGKPLSARLLPVPGVRAGEPVSFDNPLLADCIALS
ncbi:MAG TPA: DUF711 family protein [Vicinamibacterales bacterium]